MVAADNRAVRRFKSMPLNKLVAETVANDKPYRILAEAVLNWRITRAGAIWSFWGAIIGGFLSGILGGGVGFFLAKYFS